MHPRYGDSLARVTVTRSAAAPVVSVDGSDVLRLGEDVGRAAAINRAVAALDPEVGWVAVAAPGAEWGPGALDTLLAAAARHPRAALLGPLCRDTSGAERPTAGALPTLRDALRGRVAVAPVAAGPVELLTTTCVLLRRAAWDSVDGFDARYPGCGTDPEPADVDLCERLGRAGWLCVGVPAAEVTVPVEPPMGMLESRDRGLRRYVDARHGAPVRALMMLTRHN